MSQIVADLRALRMFLTNPASWAQMEFARDDDGQGIRNSDQPPCSFCLAGAIAQVIPPLKDDPQAERRRAVHQALAAVIWERWPFLKRWGASQSVIAFNDHPRIEHADVLAVIEQAEGSAR